MNVYDAILTKRAIPDQAFGEDGIRHTLPQQAIDRRIAREHRVVREHLKRPLP